MIRLLLPVPVAIVAACGPTRPAPVNPYPTTLAELLAVHRPGAKSDRFQGFVVRFLLDVTDVDPGVPAVYRRLRPGLKPLVCVRLSGEAVPPPGRYEVTAAVLVADETPGDRGIPDLAITLVLSSGTLRPVD